MLCGLCSPKLARACAWPTSRCSLIAYKGFPDNGVDLVSTSSVEPGEACRCKVTATVSGVTNTINAEKTSQRDYALAA